MPYAGRFLCPPVASKGDRPLIPQSSLFVRLNAEPKSLSFAARRPRVRSAYRMASFPVGLFFSGRKRIPPEPQGHSARIRARFGGLSAPLPLRSPSMGPSGQSSFSMAMVGGRFSLRPGSPVAGAAGAGAGRARSVPLAIVDGFGGLTRASQSIFDAKMLYSSPVLH